MNESTKATFDKLTAHARETALLGSINSLLGWDERTLMPVAGSPFRAEQMTLLAGIIHARQTDLQVGEWLDVLTGSPLAEDRHSDPGTTIRQLKRNYEKMTRVPQKLVEEIMRTAVLGQQIWEQARRDDDYAVFRPILEKSLGLKREYADAIGWTECRYDALLDDFEPDELTSRVREVLGGLRDELVPLVAAINNSGRRAPLELLRGNFPSDAQSNFGRAAAKSIGFDFHRGRLDVTAHPFCSDVGPNDVRITTRYDESFFPSAFFGILHEAGHGLYEQGLRQEHFGLPPGLSVSLGIHESQSRLWENFVGRSRSFWDYLLPQARQAFPAALADVSLADFYFAINDVRPSLIRVEADEVTYNLHILIRFELEQALINDELSPADAPQAWNQKYQDYLGLTPPDNADGILQDIHWSFGAFGYFPTYSLGNLYAAQFFTTADKELGGLDRMFARGEFGPLREWLREKIHKPGQCYRAAELVQNVTAAPLSHKPLVDYLRGKLAPLYGL